MIDEQAWLSAFGSGRSRPMIELADPDIEVSAVTLGTEARAYQGHDGLRQWMRDVSERFNARTVTEKLEWLGPDALMITGTLFVTSDLDGAEHPQAFSLVVHLKDDRARWIGTFFSRDEGKAAYEAGVTGPGNV